MKKIITFLFGIVLLVTSFISKAQVFTVAMDTVWFNPPTVLTTIFDRITVPGSSAVNVRWEVDTANSDWPADWILNTSGGSTAFCDNGGCYPTSIITSGVQENTTYFPGTGDFHMQVNITGATTPPGCYHITVKFTGGSGSLITNASETFVSCSPTLVPTVKSADEVLLYPNPATSSVNVVYDASLDIKNVAIYNIIGKMVSIYKVSGNSANLNTENLNPGFYFIRLINSQGDVAITRKFTKQ